MYASIFLEKVIKYEQKQWVSYHEYRLNGYYYFIYLQPISQSIHVKMNHFHYHWERVLKQDISRSRSTVDFNSYGLVQTLKEDHSQNDHVRRYRRVCREALKSDAKYFVCEKCHRELILAEDDRNYIEHSRLHYWSNYITLATILDISRMSYRYWLFKGPLSIVLNWERP